MAKQGSKARFQQSTHFSRDILLQNFFVLWQCILSCAVLHKTQHNNLQGSKLQSQCALDAEIPLRLKSCIIIMESWNALGWKGHSKVI